MSGFYYQKDNDGIVTITMDMEGPVNSINADFRQIMSDTVDRLYDDQGLTGVVFASAKSTFFAGGDLKELVSIKPDETEDFYNGVQWVKSSFRRLEKLKAPVVAAINGAAMGGGLELSLACNRRIIADNPRATVGCPEINLGLLPGGGGVIRTIHMTGIKKALPSLLAGKAYDPKQALEFGYVDEIIEAEDQLITKAKEWIKDNPTRWQQPWDLPGHKIPGGDKRSPEIVKYLREITLSSAQKTRGLQPGAQKIISLAAETIKVDFDTAARLESRKVASLISTPQAKNIITTTFFQMGELKKGLGRPSGVGETNTGKVGILGAGTMGAGIAYSCALAGIDVVLKDISLKAAEKGKEYTSQILDRRIRSNESIAQSKMQILDRIMPTIDSEDLSGCDLIIETVFEEVDLKKSATQEAEPFLADGGIFGSNTSTLPISILAEGTANPKNYIGIHFSSPVDRMPVIELICGKKTSDETLAKAYDFAKKIKKTPIVVNDSVGFYTSRVFDTFLDEGARLLKEGLEATLIDNLAKQTGMPMGPLEIQDFVSLDLAHKIAESQRSLNLFGSLSDTSVSTGVCEHLIQEHDRHGRASGGGYYDYPQDGPKIVWPKLYELYYRSEVSMPHEDIKERIIFRQAIESIKCLQEGVLRSVAEANIGSILAIGAPKWTGGWLQMINTYNGQGVEAFTRRTETLADKYGDRFQPPELLKEKAEIGEFFT